MEEQLDLAQQVYELIVNFAVTYSFQLFGAVIVIIAGFIIGGWVAKALSGVMEKRGVDITLRMFIASGVRLMVIGLFMVISLSQMGISITPLIAAIGGLAVGMSFALQGPVSNYGAGIVIILTRMFKVGDTISVQDCSGLVEEISLAVTTLEAEDGEKIIIPNKHIVGEIHRNSRAFKVIEGQIGISYRSDPEAAIHIIKASLQDIEGIDREHLPQVGINSFTESSILLDYRLWVSTAIYYKLLHTCNLAIFKALKASDILVASARREVQIIE